MGKEGVGGHTAVVRAPDGEIKTFPLSKKDKGEALFCQVTRDLSIEEKEYFSLCFYDREGIRHWLYNDKPIQKQLKDLPWEFSYEVKFYPTQPTSLTDDNARYNLYQQLRREIVTGRLPASIESHAILGGLQVQADVGDVQQSAEYENYLQTTQFSPYPESGLVAKIRDEHVKHKGQTQDEAILGYLDTCRQLSMYGVFLFSAKDEKDNAVNIGICASGINIYREQARLHKFSWQHIIKISFRKSNFSIELKPGQLSKKSTTVSYTTPSYYHAKRCWKCGVEHHTFFRLMQPEDKPKPGLFHFGSTRFQYHGRTQFQTKMASQLFDRPGSATVPRSQVPGTRISQSLDNVAVQQAGTHYDVTGTQSTDRQTHAALVQHHARKREVKVSELTSDDELVYLPVESPLSAAYYTYEGVSPPSTLASTQRDRGVRFESTPRAACPAESRKRVRRNLFGVSWSPSKKSHDTAAVLLTAHMPATPEEVTNLERSDEFPEIPIATRSSVYNKGFYEQLSKIEVDPLKTSVHEANQDDLEKRNEMPGYPIRYFVDVKHSGQFDKHRIARLKHAGSEDELESAKIDYKNYLFPTIEKSSVGRLEKSADVESSHIIEHVQMKRATEKPKAKKRKLGKRDSVESRSSTDSNSSSKQRSKLESTESRFLKFLRNISPQRNRETATQSSRYHYISPDRYDGPLQSIPKHVELEETPFRKIAHPKTSSQRIRSSKKSAPIVTKVKTQEYHIYGRFQKTVEDEEFVKLEKLERGLAQTMNISKVLPKTESPAESDSPVIRGKTVVYLKEVPKEIQEQPSECVKHEEEENKKKRDWGFHLPSFKIGGSRRSTKEGEEPYPIVSEPYEGPLDSVDRENDLERLPFETRVPGQPTTPTSRFFLFGPVRHGGEEGTGHEASTYGPPPYEGPRRFPRSSVPHLLVNSGPPGSWLTARREKPELEMRPRTAVVYLKEVQGEENEETHDEKENKKKRDWGFHLPSFKIGGSRRSTKEGEEPYPIVSEPYEGPLDSVDRENDLERLPFETEPATDNTEVVAVPSGEEVEMTRTAVVYLKEVPGEENEETHDEKENKKKRDWGFHLPSFKIGGSRRSTKEGEEPYPIVSEPYEGPLDSVDRENDLEKIPLDTTPVPESKTTTITTTRRFFLFGRVRHEGEEEVIEQEHVKPDTYGLATTSYEGPLEELPREDDLGASPLGEHAAVYHQGDSWLTANEQKKKKTKKDKAASPTMPEIEESKQTAVVYLKEVPGEENEETHDEKENKKKRDWGFHLPSFKIGGSRRSTKEGEEPYPIVSEPYEGPLDSVDRENDLEKIPLDTTPVPESKTTTITTTRRFFLFGRVRHEGEEEVIEQEHVKPDTYGLATTSYEGPLEELPREDDLGASPLGEHAAVYHQGDSWLTANEQKKKKTKKDKAASPTMPEIEESKQTAVVYLKEVQGEENEETHDEKENKKKRDWGFHLPSFKIGGSRRSTKEGEEPYPIVSEPYEGPLDSVDRENDLERLPFETEPATDNTEVVAVPSGEEVEMTRTAVVYLKEVPGEENEETHDEKENKKKRDWGFHLPSFKIGGSRRSTKEGEEPYPIVSEPYEGPLDSVDRENDLEKIPLDTTPVPESKTTTITTTRRFFLFGRVRHEGEEEVIEQEHVKPDTYGLATTSYEGPLEELPREDDLGASPLGEHAAVYHQGDSWLTANEQKKKKTKKDKAASPTMPEIEESKQTAVVYLKEVQGEENEETHDEKENKKKRDWGFHLPSFKIGGSRRSTKEGEEPYPIVSEPYEGPLDSVDRENDLERLPFETEPATDNTEVVAVPSGEEVEMTRTAVVYLKEVPGEENEETHDEKENKKKRDWGFHLPSFKIGGSRRSTKEGEEPYPIVSEPYEGPLDSVDRENDLEKIPLDTTPVPESKTTTITTTRRFFLFGRVRHEGEEEVIEQEHVKPDTYGLATTSYEGPLEELPREDDLGASPLGEHAAVYHQGDSWLTANEQKKKKTKKDKAASPTMPEIEESKQTAVVYLKEVQGEENEETHDEKENKKKRDWGFHLPSFKIGGSRRSTKEGEEPYPIVSEPYEGPLDSVDRENDLERLPFETEPATDNTEVVAVPSGEEVEMTRTAVVYLKEVPGEENEETHDEKENKKKRDWGFHLPSFKIGGSRRSTKEGEEPYPIVSEPYEGPLDSVDRENDLEKIPLDTTPDQSPKQQQSPPLVAFPVWPSRHEGLATTSYEGPLEELPREDDLGASPLGEHAAVYHQEVQGEENEETHDEKENKKKRDWGFHLPSFKIGGSRRSTKEGEEPYPIVSEPYEGPLDSVDRENDLERLPFETEPATDNTEVVAVPSGEEVEMTRTAVVYLKEVPGEENEETHDEKENKKKRDWGFHLPSFKIGGSRRSTKEGEEPYPIVSEPYEGPLDSVDRENDLEKSHLTPLQYQSPKQQQSPPLVAFSCLAESATKVKKRVATRDDLGASPLGEHAAVYHQGDSWLTANEQKKKKTKKDKAASPTMPEIEESKQTAVVYLKEVQGEENEETHDEKENKKKRDWGFHLPSFKIGGSRRSTKEGEEPYPIVSEPYEGPLDSVDRENDLERLPFETEPATDNTEVVAVPSGEEVEMTRTAVVYLKEVPGEENEETHDEKENKKKRDWGFHLPSFKIGGSRRSTKEGEEPYPIVSEPYEGPLDSVDRENDLEKIPLDTTPVPESKTTTITTTRRFFLFGRVRHEGEEEVIEQEHVKPDTYGLATTSYEGPLEELPREDDLGASPLGEHAAVYHQGDSWLTANEQKKKKTKKDKAASPTMPEIEESKQTAVVYLKEVQGEENEETHDEKENKKKRDWGFHLPSFKIGGSRRSTKEGEEPYPIVSEPYEGPLDSVDRENDLERLPFETEPATDNTEVVAVPSGEEVEMTRTAVVYLKEVPGEENEETHDEKENKKKRDWGFHLPSFKIGGSRRSTKEGEEPYPIVSEPYEGPLDSVDRENDLERLPFETEPATDNTEVVAVPSGEEVEMTRTAVVYLKEVPGEENEETHDEKENKKKRDWGFHLPSFKIGGSRRSTKEGEEPYPIVSEPYEGPLDSVDRENDLERLPFETEPATDNTEVVAVPSGEEVEITRTAVVYLKEVPGEENEETHDEKENKKKRDWGFHLPSFKIGGSRRSTKEGEEPYPIVSEPYEGPLDSVDRENDLERLPFETEPATDNTEVVAVPSGEEVEMTRTAVVYLKEVPGEENEETHDEKENKKKRDWGFHLPSFKIGGSRRSTKEGEEPYPIVSEPYEGPLDSVDRENDLEKIPLDTTPVPESKTTTITTTRRFFLFGRVRHEGEEEVIEQEHVKPDTYGLATTSYEGPLEELPREDDLGASPLGEHAAVYHQGDSWLTANEQKKKKTKKDKAASPTMPEIEESKQTAVVYLKEVQGEENEETHDEKENKKKRDWGFHLPSFKIGGSRRSTKEGEEPYPIVSEPYEGPLDSVDRENDLERLPFETEPATDNTEVVAVPSGEEVEMTRTAVVYLKEVPGEENEETHDEKENKKKRDWGFHLPSFKIGGSRRSTKEGEEPYPIVSEPYEGPLDSVDRENDLERLPFETEPATDNTEVVAVPSGEEVEMTRTAVVYLKEVPGEENEETHDEKENKKKRDWGFHLPSFKIGGSRRSTKEGEEPYPIVSEPYEGPLDSVDRENDLERLPLDTTPVPGQNTTTPPVVPVWPSPPRR
ncbi:unnamed protein product, partial [Mesorhabditis belari]|uniref:FERM domain-containing protein n=1 Tax=Mesorhabditis belari TaxID=2138241 RepID=A0AAF3FE69_9BILA